MKQLTIDANSAVSKIAYTFSQVIPIYPITPSSPMAELAEQCAARKERNLFDEIPIVSQLQAESGVAGAIHGAATTGSLTSTFTCSQGLLLMIPTLYKLAGEQLPCVFHVSARTVASHALSIFGDHSDVMACRQTGAIILASSNVQNAADMAIVAHLVALKLSLPVLHFFDGFRTSHEINKIFLPEIHELKSLFETLNCEKDFQKLKRRALNPEHPLQRGTAQNEDVFFQNREAANPLYEKAEQIVQTVMNAVSQLTGRALRTIDYIGNPNAKHVIASMGSSADVIKEYLEETHVPDCASMNLHLYRPFPNRTFSKTLPQTCENLSVLDRTKESGSIGEPLYLDICASMQQNGRKIQLQGGRYGLGGKDFAPQCVAAIYQNMKHQPTNHPFTVGIFDDVSHLSLPLPEENLTIGKQFECKFYGYGSDGTVGAVKRLTAAIGNATSAYVQAFFQYDSKKSGGVTLSQLRFSSTPILSAYRIQKADFIACTRPHFLVEYHLIETLKDGGILLINTPRTDGVEHFLDSSSVRILEEKKAAVYAINADKLAEEYALKGKLSTIFQAAFIHILAPQKKKSRLLSLIKDEIHNAFAKKGTDVLSRNLALLDATKGAIVKLSFTSQAHPQTTANEGNKSSRGFWNRVALPILQRKGDELPVSAFTADGSVPTATSKQEKRGITSNIPKWNEKNCIQCTLCAFSCPHTTIRAALVKDDAKLPKHYRTAKALQAPGYKFHIQVYPFDCTGCGVCLNVCPVNERERKKAHAENRYPDESRLALSISTNQKYHRAEDKNRCFNEHLPTPNAEICQKMTMIKRTSFAPQFFEFSGACAGCGETPYLKILTALLGKRLVIANATGCSSIYGATYPICPYAKDADGRGPAWANSLFENNAEFAYGMRLSYDARRNSLKKRLADYFSKKRGKHPISYTQWLQNDENIETADALYNYLLKQKNSPILESILKDADCLLEKSIWCIGGDGWAYDIGFGGVDHILSGTANVKILVLDTEVYSNTGGQQSKATPLGASVKFAENGKSTPKKPLAQMMAHYPNVYVAQCSLGANGVQFIKAVQEAEAHNGPALIVCYAPCISHGYDLSKSASHQKIAAESGYFPIFRYKNGEYQQDGAIDESKQEKFFTQELRFLPLLQKKHDDK